MYAYIRRIFNLKIYFHYKIGRNIQNQKDVLYLLIRLWFSTNQLKPCSLLKIYSRWVITSYVQASKPAHRNCGPDAWIKTFFFFFCCRLKFGQVFRETVSSTLARRQKHYLLCWLIYTFANVLSWLSAKQKLHQIIQIIEGTERTVRTASNVAQIWSVLKRTHYVLLESETVCKNYLQSLLSSCSFFILLFCLVWFLIACDFRHYLLFVLSPLRSIKSTCLKPMSHC